MSKLSPKAIAGTMLMAGFYPPRSEIEVTANLGKVRDWFDTAIAICLAESGGDTRAKNPNSSAMGLWQIMYSVHKDKIPVAIKEMKERYDYDPSPADLPNALYDPLINTVVARMVYGTPSINNFGGFRPWEVYNTGAYKSELGHGNEAMNLIINTGSGKKGVVLFYDDAKNVPGIGPSLGEKILDNTVGKVGNIVSSPVTAAVNFVKQAAPVAGMFMLGIIVLILGVWFILNKPVPLPPQAKLLKKAVG